MGDKSLFHPGIHLGYRRMRAQVIAKKEGIALIDPPRNPYMNVDRLRRKGRLEKPFRLFSWLRNVPGWNMILSTSA